MARVTFSALISAASGKIGDVVASRWKGIAYFRRRVIPSNPRSGKQVEQRYILALSLLLWQSIKAWAKTPWTLAMSGYAMSGYNGFMNQEIAALRPQFTEGEVGVDPTWTDPDVTIGTPLNASYAGLIDVSAATPGDGTLTVTWTARAGVAAANKVKCLYRADVGTAWIASAEVLESAATKVFDTLVNATEYEIALVPFNDTTDLFGLSAHQMATPSA